MQGLHHESLYHWTVAEHRGHLEPNDHWIISISCKALDSTEVIYHLVQSQVGSVEGQEELNRPKMESVMLAANNGVLPNSQSP